MSVHETQLSAARNQDKKIGKRTFSKLRWSLIAIFGVFVVLLQYSAPSLFEIQSIVFTILLFVVAIFHGVERYGARNTTVFFFITWAVSLFFEALSVHTGFPFSLYHYAMPLIIPGFGVPLTVIFAYFAAGYFSWMLSHVLTEQYSAKLNGKWIVVVPFIAAFTMVMWDLGMDPLLSSVLKQWVWQTPGPYFGVPVMNYAGWFLVVFIFYLLFALFLSKYDRIQPQKMNTLNGKPYWIEAAVIYGLIGLSIIVAPVSNTNDITLSMALVTVFTMIFVAVISFITIMNNDALT